MVLCNRRGRPCKCSFNTASYPRHPQIVDKCFIMPQEQYRKEWARFGYCRDEFPENDHFPYELYVRDARRMVSDYVITEATASRDGGDAPVSDPVAVAYWPTDTHCVRRILRDGKAHNERFIFKDRHKWRPFGIAYRSLVPRRVEGENSITPTCPSSSHVGYGKIPISPRSIFPRLHLEN